MFDWDTIKRTWAKLFEVPRNQDMLDLISRIDARTRHLENRMDRMETHVGLAGAISDIADEF